MESCHICIISWGKNNEFIMFDVMHIFKVRQQVIIQLTIIEWVWWGEGGTLLYFFLSELSPFLELCPFKKNQNKIRMHAISYEPCMLGIHVISPDLA